MADGKGGGAGGPDPADEAFRLAKAGPAMGTRWRHRKTGGVYTVVARAVVEADLTPAVVYVDEASLRAWVRPVAEWTADRFERLTERFGSDDVVA